MGPPGPSSSQYGSRYSMSRTRGPRDIISLVIPRRGDNSEDNLKQLHQNMASIRLWNCCQGDHAHLGEDVG
jgi:hypothetical protein